MENLITLEKKLTISGSSTMIDLKVKEGINIKGNKYRLVTGMGSTECYDLIKQFEGYEITHDEFMLQIAIKGYEII